MQENNGDLLKPYRIDGPAIISFSGGRTSAYMLHQIIAAHDGTLPDDVIVCFANTGKERPETLDFVHRCSEEWGVHIVWLEWRDDRQSADGARFEVVSHNSASRAGEPFAALIARKQFLPNPVTRFCTQNLKLETIQGYGRVVMGWPTWTEVVGLRADEPGRVLRTMNSKRKGPRSVACPLNDAGVTERDVLAFWSRQPFDLQLQSYEGNCDLCFLKGAGKISRIMRERPDLAQWWIDQEEQMMAAKGGAGTFRNDRPAYSALLDTTERQGLLPFDVFDDRQDCETGCTDQEPASDLALLGRRKTEEVA